MSANIDPKVMRKFSYGLFVLTAKEGYKDNGCIINTAIQATSKPERISVTVNKDNYTHDMILRTGKFNISILSEETPFEVFQHFGFKSGRDTDKFVGEPYRTENGLCYIGHYANAVISGNVIETLDCGTHTTFLADVTESRVLSDAPSITYAYYFANTKPKAPKPSAEKKKGWVCRICGYVYEGDPLPADFICPICKHGADDFEPLK